MGLVRFESKNRQSLGCLDSSKSLNAEINCIKKILHLLRKGITVLSKNGSSRTCGEITILDMSPLVDGSNIQELAKKLRLACKDIEFFLCCGPGRL